MSWQDYVDKQLLASKCVTRACIAGLDGNVWAKSEGFEVSIIYFKKYNSTFKYLSLHYFFYSNSIDLILCIVSFLNILKCIIYIYQ